VLQIWLAASIAAHDFVDPGFWQSRLGDMRDVYIPSSETFVFGSPANTAGFYSLHGNTLAAIFVAPEQQGMGIGSALMEHAKQQRPILELTVYKANAPSVAFYEKHGFVIVHEQIDEHSGHPELIMRFPG